MPAPAPTCSGTDRPADRTLRRVRDLLDPPRPRARALRAVRAGLVAVVLVGASELVAEHRLGLAAVPTRAVVFLVMGAALALLVHRLSARAEALRALSRGLEELGGALIVLDEHAWRILHASPGAAAVFRRGAHELAGMTLDQVAAPEEHARLAHQRRMRAAGHRIPARGEFTVRGGAGERLSVEVAVMPVSPSLLSRRIWLAVVRDVTAQREGERRVAAEHRFLRTVLDTAATPIAVLDAEGRIALVNGAMERLAGMGAALFSGRTPWELDLVDRAEAQALAAALRDGRDPVRHVAAWSSPGGGERTIAWTATAVRDAAGGVAHAVFIGLDVTDQRAAEDRARRAHAALELSSRELERSNRDLGQIVAAASRDLREPLATAAGAVASAEARAGTDARGQLAVAGEALLRLQARLDALGDYARLVPGEAAARDVDVSATVDEVLTDLGRELAARGASVTRDRDLPTVAGDPRELRELLGHLVAGALEHGGAAPQIHVGAKRRELGWELRVAGSGEAGSGVGLALCRRIAARHGGAIWVDEAPAGGSVVHVTLPDREAR